MIWSELEVEKYVNNILPELQFDEVFVMLMFFRSKYVSNTNENMTLSRKLIREKDPKLVLSKIKKISSQKHFYMKTYEELPEKGKCIYIDPNPKSTIKGYNKFVKEVNSNLYSITKSLMNNNDVNFKYFKRLDMNLFSCIHSSRSRLIYYLIDFDIKDEDVLNNIYEKIEKYVKCIIETKNGYHMLINVTNESIMKIFSIRKELENNDSIEFKKDFCNPVPGTLQAGFKVRFKFLSD